MTSMPLLFRVLKAHSTLQYLIVLVVTLYPLSSGAQSDCSKTLQEARNHYDLGMIDEIPKMLAPCMQEGFSRPQRIEAYKLLILAYLFDDDQFDAERTMTEFLKKFPEYEIMPNDPVEFIHLFETYRTTSEFSIGLLTGFNLANPRIIEHYTMLDLYYGEPDNATGFGYQIGLTAGRYLSKRLMVNVELQLAQHRYSFTDKSSVTDGDGNTFAASYKFSEELNQVTFPVTALYQVNGGKLLWFVRAGGSVNYVLSVSGTSSAEIKEQRETGERIDIKDYRNTYYFNAIVGSGIHYKIPRGFLSVDLRYNVGINNLVRPESRFENTYSSSMFEYLDDDFSLNTFTFSIGYSFSFYTPKKQK